jgi:hypothetical protein
MKTLMIAVFATALASGSASAQGTIGPPNGVSYRVISSHEMVKMEAVRCGYRDLSLPNGGVFRIESHPAVETRLPRLLWVSPQRSLPRASGRSGEFGPGRSRTLPPRPRPP